MTVSYDSYEAQVIQNAIAMLAGSATFQTLVGAGTATAAKSSIIETDGGAPDENGLSEGYARASDGAQILMSSVPFAIVRQGALQSQLVGVGVYDYSGSVQIILRQKRLLTGEAPAEAMRRAANVLGGVRDDIAQQFGAVNCLASGTAQSEGPYLPKDTGADGDAIIGVLTIDWFA